MPPNLSLIHTFMEAEVSFSQPLLQTQGLREDISLNPVPNLSLSLRAVQQHAVLPVLPASVGPEGVTQRRARADDKGVRS